MPRRAASERSWNGHRPMERHANPELVADRLGDDEVSALKLIVAGTAAATGDEFLGPLVRYLSAALHTDQAFIAQFVNANRVRTLAYWKDGAISDNIEFDLAGTPCEEVVH